MGERERWIKKEGENREMKKILQNEIWKNYQYQILHKVNMKFILEMMMSIIEGQFSCSSLPFLLVASAADDYDYSSL